jgi:tryptophan-rich sensory protein
MSFIPQCRMDGSSGANLKFRPPSAAFGIVWTILYLLFGLSWVIASCNTNLLNNKYIVNVLYSLITILLTLWIVVYSCYNNKKGGIFVIATCIGVIILTMNIATVISRLMLTPLLTWLLLAIFLNIFEVQLSN